MLSNFIRHRSAGHKDSLTDGLVRLKELKVLIALADWSSQHLMTSFS